MYMRTGPGQQTKRRTTTHHEKKSIDRFLRGVSFENGGKRVNYLLFGERVRGGEELPKVGPELYMKRGAGWGVWGKNGRRGGGSRPKKLVCNRATEMGCLKKKTRP